MKKKCGEEGKLGVWIPFIILIWTNTFVCISGGCTLGRSLMIPRIAAILTIETRMLCRGGAEVVAGRSKAIPPLLVRSTQWEASSTFCLRCPGGRFRSDRSGGVFPAVNVLFWGRGPDSWEGLPGRPMKSTRLGASDFLPHVGSLVLRTVNYEKGSRLRK